MSPKFLKPYVMKDVAARQGKQSGGETKMEESGEYT